MAPALRGRPDAPALACGAGVPPGSRVHVSRDRRRGPVREGEGRGTRHPRGRQPGCEDGGLILNSHGDRNEAGTFDRPAEWLDYSGPVAGRTGGLAVFNGPEVPAHPWFTRDYGPLLSNFMRFQPYLLPRGEQLRLSFRLYLHDGMPARLAWPSIPGRSRRRPGSRWSRPAEARPRHSGRVVHRGGPSAPVVRVLPVRPGRLVLRRIQPQVMCVTWIRRMTSTLPSSSTSPTASDDSQTSPAGGRKTRARSRVPGSPQRGQGQS